MDILLNVVLPLALAFIMFSLGIGLTLADFARVVKLPKAFFAGAVMQVLLMPVTAFVLLLIFPLPPELAVGVMILSFCPGGVTSNMLTHIAGGSVALSITLTGVISLLSVLTVPFLVVWAMGEFLGEGRESVSVTSIAVAMFLITTVPVALGVVLRHFASGFADRIEKGCFRLAGFLFAIIVLAALAANWGPFIENLPTLGPLLVVMNIVLLAISFLVAKLLRLERSDAIAIALEAGLQNGTLGITVGTLLVEAASGLTPFTLPSAIYGIVMYVVTIPFVFWLRGRRG
ncbi:bile acid:sodium symporter family protein [Pelagibius sp. Alg239-R121]|uniref:bile acid:sodium symporter family protein n=1 Tax=Pelagibius sp. Alg239-R121 TaxID=2993448 RepID=UPI0024A7286D|nr:bile acid:sodium symporter family protein [Pelagibius sp. Alg239-R121]